MKFKVLAGAALALALVVSGCSSRPRPYAPLLASPPADQRVFDLAQVQCTDLLVKGKLDRDGRLASAGAGAAAGGTAAVAGGATAAAVAGYGGLAVASATIVLLPFAVLGGALGMSRMKRAAKERAVKQAMEGCLREAGFEVTGWNRMSKAELAATTARLQALQAQSANRAPST